MAIGKLKELHYQQFPIRLRLEAWRQVFSESGRTDGDSRPTRIYCVQQSNGLIKIGRANNPESRLKAMRTGNADELTLIVDVAAPAGIEYVLHKELKEFRHRGEWFRPTAEVLEAVEALCSLGENSVDTGIFRVAGSGLTEKEGFEPSKAEHRATIRNADNTGAKS